MTDKNTTLVAEDYTPLKKKLQDMGDGTHAEVVSVKSGAASSVQAAIATGQTLSGFIDLGNQRLGRIGCPANVDANTKLSFETSHDGVTSRPLFDEFGTEYSIVIGASRSVVPDLTKFAAARWIKIRYGLSTAAGTVAAATRTFDLSLLA